ncbi:MAG: tyrosine-type recombinase/integrase [Elusimicrobiota bacterium]
MYQYKREPLTNDEADRLANACKTAVEKLVVYTLLDTGLRVSELASLQKDNLQWQDRRLVIFGKGGPYGKKTKRRIVPLTERAYTVISHFFSLQDKLDYSSRSIQLTVKRIAQRSGITKKVSPHVLRHTFAVTCIKRGISTRSLQQFLGHDRLMTTEIYLNMSPEDACREFMQKF